MSEEKRILEAEKRIQRILLDLEAETGQRIDAVSIDTRNYANCSTEIFLRRHDRGSHG